MSTFSNLRLEVFEAEPFLLARVRASSWGRGWLIAVPVVVFVVILQAALVYENLTVPGLAQHWCRDLTDLLGADKVKCSKDGAGGTRFPVLRDVPSLFALAVLCVTPLLIFSQWSAIEGLLPQMIRSQALRSPSASSLPVIRAEIVKANQFFRRTGRASGVLLFASALSVLLIAVSESRLGIYHSLAPGAVDARSWGRDAYEGWWASWTSAPFTSAVYLAVGTMGVYVIAIMNLAGCRVLLALWRLRRHLVYRADVDNGDGFFGWGQVRKVLLPTYVSISVHALALAAVGATLPYPVSTIVLTPVLAQWVVTFPVYMGLPFLLTRRRVAMFKAREVAQLRISLRGLRNHSAALIQAHTYYAESGALTARIDRVQSIRPVPFSRPRDTVLALANILATASGVYALINLWY